MHKESETQQNMGWARGMRSHWTSRRSNGLAVESHVDAKGRSHKNYNGHQHYHSQHCHTKNSTCHTHHGRAKIWAERHPILHQIRHETWIHANGTWSSFKTHHHLLHAERTMTIKQINFWNQCSSKSLPWRSPPNNGRHFQCQKHIW